MGINVLNNTSSQEIITTAGASITSGDLIINAESGKAFVASNTLTIAQNNNTTAGPSALVADTSSGSGDYYGSYGAYSRNRTCQLSNGTLVTVYPGNGTSSTTTNLNIVFKTLLNGGIVPSISISGSSIYWGAVRALSSGFVVLWAAGTDLRFAIYNNDGTTVLSSTSVVTSIYNFSESNCFDVKVTSNNEIVIAYSISSNGGVKFKRYNASGTLQGSETTVEASCTGVSFCISPDTSGGFWIYYYKNAPSGEATKFARYNSSGTLQGSLTTVITTSYNALAYGNFDNLVTRLPGGNVVIFSQTASTAYANIYLYDSSGTYVKTVNFSESNSGYLITYTIPGICITGTGFTIFSRGTNSAGYFWVYDSNASEIKGRTTTAYTSWSSGGSSDPVAYSQLFDLGNAGYLVVNGYNSAGTYYFTVLCFNSNGTTVGSAYATSHSSNYGQYSSLLTSDGSLYFAYIWNVGNSRNQYGMYAVQRKSVIGVAQSTVSANSNVRIATTGSYTINSSFFAGGNFDQRTATVPGTKGTVVGTSAVLFGMS